MSEKVVLQQGDVLLKQIEKPTGALKKVANINGQAILAEGEVTGHSHKTIGQIYEAADGVMVLEVPKAAPLLHEEHGTIDLKPGWYQIGRIREYDHFAEEAKQVAD